MADASRRVLLGSGGFRTEERRAAFSAAMRAFLGPIESLLFVPYALADHDRYVEAMIRAGLDGGYRIDGIHTFADPRRAVAEAEAVYVGGGNTFRLVKELYDRELLEPIRARARAGMPYMGVSAGTNVACPTMQTTNDMPIVQPPSFETLGLVPFQVNPHYYAGATFVRRGEELAEHFGETRDDRIREFHELNDRDVLGLWEGGWLVIEGSSMRLEGAPARIFRRGTAPRDVPPGTRLDELLAPH